MGIPERRQREREQRRAAIVDAAEAVFLREGFEASTMDQVAGQAEVSKGTLYLYFESKDALRFAIGERWVKALDARLAPRVQEAHTGLQGVRAILASYDAHFHNNHEHLLQVFRWMATELDAEALDGVSAVRHRQCVGQLMGRCIATIARGHEDGSIRRDLDPAALAVQLWWSFLGLYMGKRKIEELGDRVPFPLEPDTLMPSFYDVLLRGIAGPNAPEEM